MQWDTMLVKGCYAEVIEAWRKSYPKYELHVASSEDMFHEPKTFFEDVFTWIGVHNLPAEFYDNLE
eukprot:6012795-Amphidinium_carterae.1